MDSNIDEKRHYDVTFTFTGEVTVRAYAEDAFYADKDAFEYLKEHFYCHARETEFGPQLVRFGDVKIKIGETWETQGDPDETDI